MTQYVEIAVNVPGITSAFHYHLQPEMESQVKTGCLVVVPFGRQMVQGIVMGMVDVPQVPETRAIQELVDPIPVVTEQQIQLGRWISAYYLSPLGACLDMMLPPGLSQHTDLIIHLREETRPSARIENQEPTRKKMPGRRNDLEEGILRQLKERGDLRGRQLEAAFPRRNWRAALARLQRQGLVSVSSTMPMPVARPKKARSVQLAVSPKIAEEKFKQFEKRESPAALRRQAILRFLIAEPWPVEMSWVYAQSGGNASDLKKLAELGLVVFVEKEIWRDPLEKITAPTSKPLALTRDQEAAFGVIRVSLKSAAKGQGTAPLLLHGVTGSGKTEIYLQAVAETLKMGRQAIIMVPEISLTPQTIRRFLSRFPGQVGVIHSRLGMGERYDTWRRTRQGLLPVIIGPRSALFSPLPDPGLIVIDECHDDSYYQDELPNYHAVDTAIAYTQICGAVTLMGSATPDVTQMYQADSGQWKKLSLPVRLGATRSDGDSSISRISIKPGHEEASLELPPVSIVDMRQELKEGNRSILSRALQSALGDVLAAGQQAILFLNRRGSASYVFCRECGQPVRCPRCDRTLTYHESQSSLTCHACGYRRQMPKKCPVCGSAQIRQLGTGTERVESVVHELFPEAVTIRWDAETTRQKGAHDIILSHFVAHRADILIGTQMLAKGLDLPLVTLVGAILAEVALNLPDYRAAERTFQVLTQVAGRAGRSPLGGQVILQTFQPDSYAIRTAARHDYQAFYQQELAFRRQLGYPPFNHLARLEYRHLQANVAEAAAGKLAGQIRAWLAAGDRRATDMVGPVPCFFSRLNGLYRWQILLRGPDPVGLLRDHSFPDWRIEIDPPSLL